MLIIQSVQSPDQLKYYAKKCLHCISQLEVSGTCHHRVYFFGRSRYSQPHYMHASWQQTWQGCNGTPDVTGTDAEIDQHWSARRAMMILSCTVPSTHQVHWLTWALMTSHKSSEFVASSTEGGSSVSSNCTWLHNVITVAQAVCSSPAERAHLSWKWGSRTAETMKYWSVARL